MPSPAERLHEPAGPGRRASAAPAASALPASLTVPTSGFAGVARSVAGSVAAGLDLPFETIDDLQLAVELVLRSKLPLGSTATISLAAAGTTLVVTIEGLEGIAPERLRRPVVDGIALGDTLARLVDEVDVIATPRPALALRTALPAAAT